MTRRGILLFAALGILWGIPYVFIKIVVGEVPPVMLVLARTGIAAVLLLPVALARGQVLPVLRRWRPLLAYTVAEIVVPWYFLNDAERHLPSSTAGLILAAVPLAGLGVAAVMGRREHLTPLNWLGIVLGMVGVAALVGFDVGGSSLLAVGEMLIVVVGYAFGPFVLSHWMSDQPGLGVVALSLTISALVYVPVVLLTGSWPAAWPSAQASASIAVLAVLCSAVAFLVFFALVGEIGPVRTTAITYVNPAVAIAAGAIVLGERITVWTVAGFVLVLAGSYLVTRRVAVKRDEPVEVPAP